MPFEAFAKVSPYGRSYGTVISNVKFEGMCDLDENNFLVEGNNYFEFYINWASYILTDIDVNNWATVHYNPYGHKHIASFNGPVMTYADRDELMKYISELIQ